LRIGLPIGLGAVALGTAGTFVFLGLSARDNAQRANNAAFTSDADQFAQQARHQAVWANVSLGIALTSAAGALLSYFLLNPTRTESTAAVNPPATGPGELATW
jgi:hypothetical protein